MCIYSAHQRLTGADLGLEIESHALFAQTYGVDTETKVVIDGILPDGTVVTESARLAKYRTDQSLVARSYCADLQPIKHINGTLDLAFGRYFERTRPGFWIDRFGRHGAPMVSAVPEAARYHIFPTFAEVLCLQSPPAR